ncbi:MAG TPA: hypothetical protein VGG68_00760 [Caulobacteraceae bacterium]
MSGDGLTRAPWTPEQVAALNEWQACGWVHEFTCGNDHPGTATPPLVATPEGWRCADERCAYRQTWAYAMMLDGAPPNPFKDEAP